MWRVTRYLFAFASGQAFEAWLSTKLERPSFADHARRAGAWLDEELERYERWLAARNA